MRIEKKSFFLSILILGFSLFTGCTSAPRSTQNISPEELFERACSPGSTIHGVRGTVWFKTKSKEISGQYAANVMVPKPGQLKLEITNFLGGTEALISVSDDHYTVTGVRGKTDEKDEGDQSWGGIPLQFATDLFLGRMPCRSIGQEKRLSFGPEGELVAEVKSFDRAGTTQRFVFTFRDHEGKKWPKSLHWERLTSPVSAVDFKFDDPEKQTLSPKKWEAHSDKGAIKVHWREREVSRLN